VPDDLEDVLAEARASLAAGRLPATGSRLPEGGEERRGGMRRYPLPLVREAEGRWIAEHRFERMGDLEIVKVHFLGSREAFVVAAFVTDGTRPGSACRSPFGPGERVAGLRLPLWMFGTTTARVDLVPPLSEWRPGEIVRFETEGFVEAGALVCRKKGTP
jgi:hypothetical protein